MKDSNFASVVLLVSLSSVSAAVANAAWIPLEAAETAAQLPAPPRAGSAEDRADFREILKLQSSRTPAESARAASEVQVSLAGFFGPPYGPLTESEVARLAPALEELTREADVIVQHSKRLWARPRPYAANPAVEPIVKKEITGAYPSGHAALARLLGQTLAELFPERATALRTRADQVGLDRVLAGVHHPSDIRAGWLLGDRILAVLRPTANYRDSIAGLRRVARAAPARDFGAREFLQPQNEKSHRERRRDDRLRAHRAREKRNRKRPRNPPTPSTVHRVIHLRSQTTRVRLKSAIPIARQNDEIRNRRLRTSPGVSPDGYAAFPKIPMKPNATPEAAI